MAPKYSPARRRVYKKSGEKINRLEIFERDNWLCGICDEQIDKDARLPHPLAATLDHIIPVALGGLHIRENLQAAHHLCNQSKGCNSGWTEIMF